MTTDTPPPRHADPSPAASRLAARIRDKALELGFDAIGFCPATLGPEARTRLQDFLANGYHGEMSWLAERMEQRSQPTALWPEARTVIALGTSYAPEGDALATLQKPECGNISVYARHRDYHDVIKGMLKHLAQFVVREGKQATPTSPEVKVFVDTAPVAEKPLAAQAGLGWQGKHTNLVSRRHGSWLFLGEIYTTLALPASPPSGGGCGSCSRCLTACPTQAFPAPYQMDARRCISYLTIEHAGPIPTELRPLIGTHIYGCDDCLTVCPWNRFARTARHIKLQPRADLIAPDLATLSQLDDAAFRTLFSGSPIKRIGRNRFIRNVLIAIGNSRTPSLLPHARALCTDPDAIVRDAAQWSVAQLESI
ncbi:MAG: tRNA epoxyqueuosine(34) reductase QueG [Acetobacter syzygii]|uniref:tRNA epoxyqueuosine(34) reductase QueG n=1 Tax=Acetobacter syzygii TaxID=146476 RepID=UPI0039E7F569